jgi:hypothetical protein
MRLTSAKSRSVSILWGLVDETPSSGDQPAHRPETPWLAATACKGAECGRRGSRVSRISASPRAAAVRGSWTLHSLCAAEILYPNKKFSWQPYGKPRLHGSAAIRDVKSRTTFAHTGDRRGKRLYFGPFSSSYCRVFGDHPAVCGWV